MSWLQSPSFQHGIDLTELWIHMLNVPRVPRGSDVGEELYRLAEEFKNKGNEALKEQNYEVVLLMYSAALEKSLPVANNEEQCGVILSNASYASMLMNRYEDATILADMCIQIRPYWYKGYYRKMQALRAKGKNRDAVDVGIMMQENCTFSNDEELKILKEIMKIACQTEDDFKQVKKLHLSEGKWTNLVIDLAKDNDWHIIHMLTVRNADTDPVISAYKANNIQLSGLLEKCSQMEWKEWGEKLAVNLIQKGAPLDSLDPKRKHPLHAAVKIAIKTGSHGLLEYLFEHYIPTADRNRLDDDQNTLLHIACKGSYDAQENLISLLLENYVDPTIKNKSGLWPVELLPADSSCVAPLLETMKKKGFSIHLLNLPKGKGQVIHQHMERADDVQEFEQRAVKSLQMMSVIDTRKQNQDVHILSHLSHIKQWNASDVRKWLEEKQLDFMKSRLKSISGAELRELWMMLKTAPNFFYQSLPPLIGLSANEMLKLGSSLRELECDMVGNDV